MSEQHNINTQDNGAELSKAQLEKQRNIKNNTNNIKNAADVAIASKNPYGVAIGGAVKAADKISGGKTTERLGKTMNTMNRLSPKGRQIQALSNKLNESGASDAIGQAASAKNAADGKSSAVGASKVGNASKEGPRKLDSEKSMKQKDDEAEQKSLQNGTFKVGLKKKTLFKLGLSCSIGFFCLMLFIIQLSIIADNEGVSIVMGEMVGEDKVDIEDIHDEIGEGNSSELGMGNSNVDKEIDEHFALLGNVFSSENLKCEGEDCLSRPEYRYYLKVADIAYRYKYKYGINLDWILLNATVQYNDMTQEAIMTAHINDYNLEDVEELDKLINLDWDYDYKKISGYAYLDPDDYRYDLQILAKNMVAKTTTQLCQKITKDSEGNIIDIETTKEQIDQDVEEQYFKPGEKYYLKCSSGETYSIDSVYTLDAEKYDEFLLEYLEHKFYLKRVGIDPITGETDMTPSDASGDYIFPLPSGATSCRSSAYGPRIHPISGKYNDHSGDDYPAASGTPVYAVKDGVVTSAGTGCTVGDTNCNGGMGNYVIIDHENGISSIYMHASTVYVSSGDRVNQGDVIMAVGTTGSSTGNHLHITFKKNGVKDNPANYIGALPMCY